MQDRVHLSLYFRTFGSTAHVIWYLTCVKREGCLLARNGRAGSGLIGDERSEVGHDRNPDRQNKHVRRPA